ncbi:MAG: long-chain acyl-[acyl-carrier-protein] reductase [Cyanobacteria bacterium J06623_5]
MFGLIGHLTSLQHAREACADMGFEEFSEQGLDFWCSAPPRTIDDIKVTSATGQTIEGRYVESFFLPEMLAAKRIKAATRKVLNAMAHAQKNGVDITALGGFSSIIFENFKLEQIKRVRNLDLDFRKFTTGNTHTAYVICKQVEEAAPKLGINLAQATVAVCGATGDIGSAVCRWLTARTGVKDLLLVARNQERLNNLKSELNFGRVQTLDEALPQADVVVWVASMPKGVEVELEGLKQPCLMVDGGYPKNIDVTFARPGITVLKGGIVEHTLDIDWRIMNIVNMDVPGRQLFACFAESMLLEFEKLHTNFSWGRNQITLEKMDLIGEASRRHGFRPLLT